MWVKYFNFSGGVFFIPFLIFFFTIGIPIFTLESVLGQVFKKGPVEVFSMIKKQFAGIGWASVIVSWIISIYYAIILCWSVFYFFQSFKSPLPWSREAIINLQNTSNFHDLNSSYSNLTNITQEEDYINIDYFIKKVLKQSEGIENMGSIDGELTLCLIVTYVIIFLCISKGIKSSSKVVYVTAPAPIILLIILLFKVLTLPGISLGLKFLFLPDLSKLSDPNVWIKASNQVVFMISIGIGCNILFSSFRKENEDIYVSSFWIPTLTVIFGIMCSIINFSYLGHFSYLVNIPLDKLPLSGTDLAFISYPSALCMLPFPNLWSILFFFMLITLGIDSQVKIF